MVEHVKIRLTTDTREIEVEGTRNDVDELLAAWWKRVEVDTDEGGAEEEPSKSRVPRKAARRASPRKASSGDDSKAFDPQPTVNDMREEKQFETWEINVLHTKDLLAKIKLVCWYFEQPMTSGEIHKTLTALNIRTHQPNISSAIKRNISDFTQDNARTKGAVIRYKLTGKAATDFEAGLNKNE